MEGLHETTPTPDQCQKQVSESAWKTFDELSNELDRICITFGFTMSKMSGSKRLSLLSMSQRRQREKKQRKRKRNRKTI